MSSTLNGPLCGDGHPEQHAGEPVPDGWDQPTQELEVLEPPFGWFAGDPAGQAAPDGS